MAGLPTSTNNSAGGGKFPVLTTRLAEVEAIVRPKIARRPASLAPKTELAKTAIASAAPVEEEKNPFTTPPEEPTAASAKARRRVLTARFVALLVVVVVGINFAIMWFMDRQHTPAPSVATTDSPIMLGTTPDAIPAESAVVTPAPVIETAPAATATASAPAQDQKIEVVPYHRSYDPALIERLEQAEPAAGTP